MHEAVASPLQAWENFYVIVGSSAGALTGLQFVVMTLIGEAELARGDDDPISAFGTPNVVHFCVSLLLASILSAPWSSLLYPGLAVAVCGVLGVVYSVIVMRRARRQNAYVPVLEDWVWHTALPALAYSALLVAGIALERRSVGALFAIGAAMLLLVFIGIHNGWDTVTYMTRERGKRMAAEVSTGGGAQPRTGATAPGSSSLPGVTGADESAASRPSG